MASPLSLGHAVVLGLRSLSLDAAPRCRRIAHDAAIGGRRSEVAIAWRRVGDVVADSYRLLSRELDRVP